MDESQERGPWTTASGSVPGKGTVLFRTCSFCGRTEQRQPTDKDWKPATDEETCCEKCCPTAAGIDADDVILPNLPSEVTIDDVIFYIDDGSVERIAVHAPDAGAKIRRLHGAMDHAIMLIGKQQQGRPAFKKQSGADAWDAQAKLDEEAVEQIACEIYIALMGEVPH